MLDTVVERKVLCDFLSTIKSKRHYHSQKVRLQRCGLNRAIYLVEGQLERWPHVAERQRMAHELATIEMADRLLVHVSRSTDDTIRFLRAAVERLQRTIGGRDAAELRCAGLLKTYEEFETATNPPELVSAAFGRMLLNLHGLSPPMIANVLAKYPSPRALAEAMECHERACVARGLPSAHARWLLADDLVPGKRRRKLSETITDFVMAEEYPTPPAPPASQTQI